jgi:lysophospholipid acyltransferase 7
MRDALKSWNMTVQWWLVANIYRRLPGISRGLRTVAVMVTSSAWHGVYVGYYLSLGSVPLVLAVEDMYEKIIRKRLEDTRFYDFVAWFMRFQWFSYLGMGFQLLRVDSTMKFWHSIIYLGHLILPTFYVIGLYIVNPLAKAAWPSEDKKLQ